MRGVHGRMSWAPEIMMRITRDQCVPARCIAAGAVPSCCCCCCCCRCMHAHTNASMPSALRRKEDMKTFDAIDCTNFGEVEEMTSQTFFNRYKECSGTSTSASGQGESPPHVPAAFDLALLCTTRDVIRAIRPTGRSAENVEVEGLASSGRIHPGGGTPLRRLCGHAEHVRVGP